MKLTIKLLKGTLTYEVPISTKVRTDGDLVLVRANSIENANKHEAIVEYASEVVKSTREPTVKALAMVRTDTASSCAGDKIRDAQNYLTHVREDTAVQDIRAYLDDRLSDKDFDRIVIAMERYISEVLRSTKTNDGVKRIRELTYISMFTMAGEKSIDAFKWLCSHVPDIALSYKKYEQTVYGYSTGSRLIAMQLWPQRCVYKKVIATKPAWVKVIERHNRIIDAALKGYSTPMLSVYFGVSNQCIYNVLNGKTTLRNKVDYDGEYPIRCEVKEGNKLPITTCRCCGAIIPVKRLLYMPGIKICVNCQDNEEKKPN